MSGPYHPYSLTERVRSAFGFLNRGLGDHPVNGSWYLVPLMMLVSHRLQNLRNRLLSLIAAFEAGRLSQPRRPRPSAAAGAGANEAEAAEGGAGAAKSRPDRKPSAMEAILAPLLRERDLPMPRLPGRLGWLMRLAPEQATRTGRYWLELLLAGPKMADLIALAPERAGRVLRPLCRAVDLPVPEALRLPKRERKRRSRANPAPCGKSLSRSGAMPGSPLFGVAVREWPLYLRPLPRSIELPRLIPARKRTKRPAPSG